jgi:hypothetical protein
MVSPAIPAGNDVVGDHEFGRTAVTTTVAIARDHEVSKVPMQRNLAALQPTDDRGSRALPALTIDPEPWSITIEKPERMIFDPVEHHPCT